MESQHQLLKDISAGQQASGSDGPEEFLERDAAVAELHDLLTSFRNAATEEGDGEDEATGGTALDDILASFEKSKSAFFSEVASCAEKLETFIPLCRKFNIGCSDALSAINEITEDLKAMQEQELDLSMINVNSGTGQKIDELEVQLQGELRGLCKDIVAVSPGVKVKECFGCVQDEFTTMKAMFQDFDAKLKKFRENSQDFERLATDLTAKMEMLETTMKTQSVDQVKDKSELGRVQESVNGLLVHVMSSQVTLGEIAALMNHLKPVAKDDVTKSLQSTLTGTYMN